MRPSILSRFLLLVCFHIVIAHPTKPSADLIASLDYITLQGAYSAEYNLSYYRKIPFGASTAGNNRFRAPQPPPRFDNGTYNSDQSFDMCVQRTVNGSEDCLYLGLYSRPWDGKSLRPVLLTFYGGGFIQGSASFTIPPSGFPVLNESESNDYVVIYSNYRTNVFGFLASEKIAKHKDVDLNNGLLDQQAALKWIQKYVHHFGGDAKNVTIWGQSAGGGSVVAQTIATGNRGKGLFTKAMASSPFWSKTYRYNDAFNEGNYESIVNDVGCKGAKDEIACLKSADLQALRNASLKVAASHTYNSSSYSWGPVVDDEFLTEPLTSVIKSGKLNAELVMGSYNLHEGENFIPPGLQSAGGSAGFNSSTASFDTWLSGFLPDFDSNELQQVKEQYPAQGIAEDITWNSTYTRAGLLYRDLVLACPAYWIAKTASKGGWLIDYTISPAKHASDTIYWNQVNAVQKTDPLTYDGYAGAMASFVQTGDPNAHKVTSSSVVEVPEIDSGSQFVVAQTGLANEKIARFEERCAFWLKQGSLVPV